MNRTTVVSFWGETFLAQVVAYIEDHMATSAPNVEELSREMHMSKVTLYRKIKTLTGRNTVEFIRFIRMKRAAQLLATQQYSIQEVTYLVGFSDVDYFRKCFKAQFKQTPTAYAGRHGKNRKLQELPVLSQLYAV